MRPFTDVLRDIRKGKVVDSLSERLAEVVQGVLDTNKGGEACRLGRPGVDFLNDEEVTRIRQLICAGTWPNGWDGDEPTADTPMAVVHPDGAIQPLIGALFASGAT